MVDRWICGGGGPMQRDLLPIEYSPGAGQGNRRVWNISDQGPSSTRQLIKEASMPVIAVYEPPRISDGGHCSAYDNETSGQRTGTIEE